jgi:hypothetical protein
MFAQIQALWIQAASQHSYRRAVTHPHISRSSITVSPSDHQWTAGFILAQYSLQTACLHYDLMGTSLVVEEKLRNSHGMLFT